jgi:hypothetical protein
MRAAQILRMASLGLFLAGGSLAGCGDDAKSGSDGSVDGAVVTPGADGSTTDSSTTTTDGSTTTTDGSATDASVGDGSTSTDGTTTTDGTTAGDGATSGDGAAASGDGATD